MKFDCGRRHSRLTNWHSWFAWYPTRISGDDCRWLETVERKGTLEMYGYDPVWVWEYRVK